MRTTRRQPAQPAAKSRNARLRRENPDLADLVASKTLTLREAEGAATARARARNDAELRSRASQAGDVYLANGLPAPENVDDKITYLLYVLAHQRNTAGDVKYGRLPLSEAVLLVHRSCPFPCDDHRPVPASLIEEFREKYADRAVEAEDVIGYATELVPALMATN